MVFISSHSGGLVVLVQWHSSFLRIALASASLLSLLAICYAVLLLVFCRPSLAHAATKDDVFCDLHDIACKFHLCFGIFFILTQKVST